MSMFYNDLVCHIHDNVKNYFIAALEIIYDHFFHL